MTNIITKNENNEIKYMARNGKWTSDPAKAHAFDNPKRDNYLYHAGWLRKKLQNDPVYRWHRCLLKACRYAIRYTDIRNKYTSKSPYFKWVGYSPAMLAFNLESQFLPGMTWKNYGTVWNIDHKVPACICKDMDTLKKIWRLDNIRPCFVQENMHKGRTVPDNVAI